MELMQGHQSTDDKFIIGKVMGMERSPDKITVLILGLCVTLSKSLRSLDLSFFICKSGT